jgi:hypothetical protein
MQIFVILRFKMTGRRRCRHGRLVHGHKKTANRGSCAPRCAHCRIAFTPTRGSSEPRRRVAVVLQAACLGLHSRDRADSPNPAKSNDYRSNVTHNVVKNALIVRLTRAVQRVCARAESGCLRLFPCAAIVPARPSHKRVSPFLTSTAPTLPWNLSVPSPYVNGSALTKT